MKAVVRGGATLALAVFLFAAPAAGEELLAGGPELLDPAAWTAAPADGVELAIAADAGPDGGPALRLDYDFHGHGGWAAARLPLELGVPEHWELRFQVRGEQVGETPPNHLEVKLVDPSGDNVWWHVRRDWPWPADWAPVRVKARQVEFAWGPAGGGDLERIGALELTVTAGGGGRGTLWIADLELVETEPPRPPDGPPAATATSTEEAARYSAARAVDGDEDTAWRPSELPAALTVDLRGDVELGGLTLRWEEGRAPARFLVELSEDGETWPLSRQVDPAGAADSHLRLGDVQARRVRVTLPEGACPAGCGLAEAVVRPLAFGASPNAFFQALAAEAPRGSYPRGFSEAVFWTVVGADGAGGGDPAEALVSEDGAVEVGERGVSLEPFIALDGRLWGWDDVAAELSLADGDLPIPTVAWPLPGVRLEVTALAAPAAGGGSDLWLRYRLAGGDLERRRVRLLLAARPFQVNPPYQFLNVAGGVAPVEDVACRSHGLEVDGKEVSASPPPTACGALTFHQGRLVDLLAAGGLPAGTEARDAEGRASGVLAWDLELEPMGERQVILRVPLATGIEIDGREGGVAANGFSEGEIEGDALAASAERAAAQSARAPAPAERSAAAPPGEPPPAASGLSASSHSPRSFDVQPVAAQSLSPEAFDAQLAATRSAWREVLDGVTLDLPPEAEPLAETLRSSLAYVLIHRDGAAIQPGSRAYARSWIRDGALTGAALLRLGRFEEARSFAEWFAGFQYADGKVPCCVDRHGAGPVPEHDSHGELIHLVREVHRYTGDDAFARRLFPHVAAAARYIDALRRQRRTGEYRRREGGIFFGLLPESISHEGYSARPVHSYWDDAFAYRGLADAAELAAALGHHDEAALWGEWRDEFVADFLASIAAVMERGGVTFIPGSADLADFDSTATTVLLDPAGLGPHLPRGAVEATFERYWDQLADRRAGAADWDAYTPYEIRHVGAFVRLGWIERAHELLDYFIAERRPPAWNAWPEVVTRRPREPRFNGDLPHGWVASDYVRSLLDLFAYERRDEEALVLAAGVPAAWLERPEGVAVAGLATPWGELSFRVVRGDRGVRYTFGDGSGAAALRPPPGGLVLTWPLAGRPAAALVDGLPAALEPDGTLRLDRVPAAVDLVTTAAPGGEG